MRRPACLLNHIRTALLATVMLGVSSRLVADEFQISLEGGSVITVDVDNESFRWTNVLENGEMIKEQLKFSDIQQLVLSDSPASEQVADIRRLISLLESPEYLKRQMAEDKLSDPEIGGNFRSMIKTQVGHKNYEVRYRIERILDKLELENVDPNNSEFDKLVLKDGTVKEGDAGEFKLECVYRKRKMTFSRKDIRLISMPIALRRPAMVNADVQVRMFHNHAGNFYLPNQTTVDFDLAPNGSEIPRNANVDEMFTPVGLRMGTEQVGYVGISGYGFKFDLPPTGNSVCVFETIGTYSKRFKGVMEISFCMPNQKAVSAGVNEVGLFMARVNHSRDFLVEAYNADGQILASVEATDQACVFAGVKSNEPITKLRILSNPYLFRLDRTIDEDYAVDSICFSKPFPVATPLDDGKAVLHLKNGDLIQGDSITIIDRDSISIDDSNADPIVADRRELQAIRFNTIETKRKDNQWIAMLPDRSTLFVEPGKTFSSKTFPLLKFKPDQLMGLWSSRNPARFPEATDFQQGKEVMVFPTCRIASEAIAFSDEGYRWEKSAKKIQQPIQTGDKKADEDPTPQISSVEYGDTWSENIPTIWMKPPKTLADGTGMLRLVDGQQLVLGGESGFKLTNLDKTAATVSIAGRESRISIKQILSIEFPSNE